MRRDEWEMVGGVLRDYPKINRDRVLLEQFLEVLALSAHSDGVGTHVSGGTGVCEEDKLLEVQDDAKLRRLRGIVERVYSAYRTLSESEQRVIGLSCFRQLDQEAIAVEMHREKRQIQRIKAEAFERMRDVCVCVFPDVLAWRRWEDKEIANCLMPLLQRNRGNNSV